MTTDAATCALLDGSTIAGLPQWIAAHACTAWSLFDTHDAGLAAAGPWLVRMPDAAAGSGWIDAQLAAGRGVGVIYEDDCKPLRRHFRRFLSVRTPTGETTFFRFYDPRVLLAFLPECDEMELREFFGPISAFQACAPQLGLTFTLRRGPRSDLQCVARGI